MEHLLQLMTPMERRRLALLRALAARTHCDPEGLVVTPSMAALYHGHQGSAKWWRDVQSVWNLEHFPPSDGQGSPVVAGIVDRICVSVSETSVIDDMAKCFGLKGPSQLYQEFDPVSGNGACQPEPNEDVQRHEWRVTLHQGCDGIRIRDE
jgi:hypothetical protein